MNAFPSKQQWKNWSLPSKLTAIGTYLAVTILVVSILTGAVTAFYDLLQKQYWITETNLKNSVFKEYTGKNMDTKPLEIKASILKINSIFKRQIFNQANKEIFDTLKSNLKPNVFELRRENQISLKNKRILSIIFKNYSYYEGAFNGDGSYGAINIDLKNDQHIEFYDLFDIKKNPLNSVKKILREHLTCSIFESKYDDNQYIPRFALSEKEVIFLFSEYEVSPGICGYYTVKIAYELLGSLIRKDGPIGNKFNSTGNWDGREHKKSGVGMYY